MNVGVRKMALILKQEYPEAQWYPSHQTCANYFNGKWKGMAFRGPIRKKIEDLQGGIGGTESSSKWRLLTPRKK